MQRVFAHRGSSLAYAENTRAAYQQAIDEGADGVECDVQLSQDLHVVCHHDQTVDRTSDGTGSVAGYTLRELRRLDFSSWKGARVPDPYGARSQQLVTLPEILEMTRLADREIGLAIELKHPSPFGRKLEERVLAELMRAGWDPETSRIGKVAVSLMSFDPGSIDYLLQGVPGHHLCQLVTGIDEDFMDDFGMIGRAAMEQVILRTLDGGIDRLDAGAVGIAGPGVAFARANSETLRRWIGAGLRIRAWTVDADDDVDYLVGLGVQELTSNRPAHVKRHLAARNGAVPPALAASPQAIPH